MPLNATSHPWDTLMQAMTWRTQVTTRERSISEQDALIARATTGCNYARAALLREIEDPCFRFCLSQLSNPDSARDATQETALRVLRSLNRYRGEASFTTWALSIALNVCREHRRRRRWLTLPADWSNPDPAPGPHDQADGQEQSSRLMRALQRLPQRQRETVTLRYLHGLSTRETAHAMRCAQGTVKATLAKALNTLRQQWEQDDA